jgi:ABC-type dipeptide/oligopeptide/nickel transport system ATPase component
LLIGSIPRVSTVRDWATEQPQEDREVAAAGCKFADRCPLAMPRCLAAAPPLFQIEPRRAAACFIYENAPVLAGENVATVLEAASA